LVGLVLIFVMKQFRNLALFSVNASGLYNSEGKEFLEKFFEGVAKFYLDIEGIWYFIAIGLILGFIFSLRDACQEIKRFSFIKNPYQRLRSGVVYNCFEWIMLFLIIIFTSTLHDFYNLIYIQKVDNRVLIVGVILTVIAFPLAIILGTIGGYLFSPFGNHFILRFCLYLEGAMPLKYVTFLDYAARAGILEKDGGFWRFRHQNLQEYFANLE
jgi:hypothetical protein